MKIKLLGVSLDPRELELGTCEQCYSVKFAQFPTFEFEIDDLTTEYVEMYEDDAPYSYEEVDMDNFDIDDVDGIGNAIDFADWLNQNEFRELDADESLTSYLYNLTYTYSYGIGIENPSNQEYIDDYWLKK